MKKTAFVDLEISDFADSANIAKKLGKRFSIEEIENVQSFDLSILIYVPRNRKTRIPCFEIVDAIRPALPFSKEKVRSLLVDVVYESRTNSYASISVTWDRESK